MTGTTPGVIAPIYERRIVLGLIGAGVAVRLYLNRTLTVSWDEFYYLSLVHDHLRGSLALGVQTFHVHVFGWLAPLAENEVDQIVAARTVMLGVSLLTAGFLYRIASRMSSSDAARYAVLAYLSVSLVVRTGASFRADAIAVCLVMAAFDALLRPRAGARHAALAGVLVAVATMVTIKTAIFLPSLGLVAALPVFPDSHRRRWPRAGTMAGAGAACFGTLYWMHTASLAGSAAQSSVAVATEALATTWFAAGVLPQWRVLVSTLTTDFVFWILLGAGGVTALRRLLETTGADRARLVAMAALALPIASVVAYRNSFPYFYPTILAPAAVLVAEAWHQIIERRSGKSFQPPRVVAGTFVLVWCIVNLLVHGVVVPTRLNLHYQRELLDVIHRMFPEPAPYLDRSSMVASFPQAGFFMSTWGLGNYRERGEPLFDRAIVANQPPLLIANHPLLDLRLNEGDGRATGQGLLEADRTALRSAYIHHWGPLYVAGVRVALDGPQEPASFTLRIAGRYTLESASEAAIDGQVIQPRGTVQLGRGEHSIVSAARDITLRWGEHLYRPGRAAPDQPVFLE